VVVVVVGSSVTVVVVTGNVTVVVVWAATVAAHVRQSAKAASCLAVESVRFMASPLLLRRG
jgi:hypothetical protein